MLLILQQLHATPNEDTDTDHSDSKAKSCIKLRPIIGIAVITLVAILIVCVFIAIIVVIDAVHTGRL